MNNVTFIKNRNTDLFTDGNRVSGKKNRNLKSGVAKSVSFSNNQYLNLDDITASVYNQQA